MSRDYNNRSAGPLVAVSALFDAHRLLQGSIYVPALGCSVVAVLFAFPSRYGCSCIMVESEILELAVLGGGWLPVGVLYIVQSKKALHVSAPSLLHGR